MGQKNAFGRMISRFWRGVDSATRPHYLFRPGQLMRRLLQRRSRAIGRRVETLPWGHEIEIDPGEHIGRSIWMYGIYDIAVTEVLWRLLDSGGTAVDVGAHIGYMTSVMAHRVGASGRIVAIEPHPQLFTELERNVRRICRSTGGGDIQLYNCALSEKAGAGSLVGRQGDESNLGQASLDFSQESADSGNAMTVRLARLDELFHREQIDVLKVDVEGHEEAVFRGGQALLDAGCISHIVYECHDAAASVHRWLQKRGYEVFGIGWWRLGLRLSRGPEYDRVFRSNESPCFVATKNGPEVERKLSRWGWQCLC